MPRRIQSDRSDGKHLACVAQSVMKTVMRSITRTALLMNRCFTKYVPNIQLLNIGQSTNSKCDKQQKPYR